MSALAMFAALGCDVSPDFGAVQGGMLGGPSNEPNDPSDGDGDPGDSSSSDSSGPGDLLDLGGGDSSWPGDSSDSGDSGEPSGPPCSDHSVCVAFAGPCSAGVCGPNGCESIPYADGLECTPLDKGVIAGSCSAGECVGEPMDCSALDSACTIGECHAQLGACVSIDVECEQQQPEPEPEPEPEPACPIGALGCPCTGGGACDPGLVCGDGLECMEPIDACGGVSIGAYQSRTIVGVPVVGAMSDANTSGACSACGLDPLCGSTTNPAACPVGYAEEMLGPVRRCKKQLAPNQWSVIEMDRGLHDGSCVELAVEPNAEIFTTHQLLAAALGCGSLGTCAPLQNTWSYAAGNYTNQVSWNAQSLQWQWVSIGAIGVKAGQWSAGLASTDGLALCVVP